MVPYVSTFLEAFLQKSFTYSRIKKQIIVLCLHISKKNIFTETGPCLQQIASVKRKLAADFIQLMMARILSHSVINFQH